MADDGGWSGQDLTGHDLLYLGWAARRLARAGLGWPDRDGRGDPLRPQPGAGHRGADGAGRGCLVQAEAGLLLGQDERAEEADRGPGWLTCPAASAMSAP